MEAKTETSRNSGVEESSNTIPTPEPDCPVCLNKREQAHGKEQGFPCPACRPEAYRAALDEKWLVSANIPKRFWPVTVGNYQGHTESQENAKATVRDYCRNLKERVTEGEGLTLWGSVGAGKTHLAVSVLKAARHFGLSGYFIAEDGLFDKLKEEWSEPVREMAFLQRLQRARVLVIDDMGIRKPSDYVSERYEAIINTRYANGLPTTITTNRPPRDLAEVYERQMSRLSGNAELKIIGPDARGMQP